VRRRLGQPKAVNLLGSNKHRWQRRDGRCHQHHAGADRAVIVGCRILIRGRLVRRGRRSVGGDLCMARADGGQAEILRMNMAERKNRLQRQRKQREADISPDMRANPAHRPRMNSPRTNKRDFVYGRTIGYSDRGLTFITRQDRQRWRRTAEGLYATLQVPSRCGLSTLSLVLSIAAAEPPDPRIEEHNRLQSRLRRGYQFPVTKSVVRKLGISPLYLLTSAMDR
jgi:hypothetical protein